MNQQKPKVTVLSPCYNGEKYLKKYFNDLLAQTYKNYEVIIVNDGSKDNSMDIIMEYQKLFEQEKISFTVIDKKINEGQAKALNDGLKKVSGELLVWPDIDDHMHPDYLLKKVEVYEKDRDIDIVISKCPIYNYANLNKVVVYAWDNMQNVSKEQLIDNYIHDRNVYYMSGAFMVKTQLLFKIYPDRNIFVGVKAGPTIQMVFPMIYFGKVGYDNAGVFDYYIHGNNQHIVHGIEQLGYMKEIYNNVLENMNIAKEVKERYLDIVEDVSYNAILGQCLQERNILEAKKIIVQLKQKHKYKFKYRLKYIFMRSACLHYIYMKFKSKII